VIIETLERKKKKNGQNTLERENICVDEAVRERDVKKGKAGSGKS